MSEQESLEEFCQEAMRKIEALQEEVDKLPVENSMKLKETLRCPSCRQEVATLTKASTTVIACQNPACQAIIDRKTEAQIGKFKGDKAIYDAPEGKAFKLTQGNIELIDKPKEDLDKSIPNPDKQKDYAPEDYINFPENYNKPPDSQNYKLTDIANADTGDSLAVGQPLPKRIMICIEF